MRDNRIFAAVALFGLLAPAVLVWWLHMSRSAALLVLTAPWVNWSVYVLGFLALTLIALICGHILRTHWALALALGFVYWATGCMFGALQAGKSPVIAPEMALPYIRGLWLLGSAAVLISSAGILTLVVHVETRKAAGNGVDSENTNAAA